MLFTKRFLEDYKERTHVNIHDSGRLFESVEDNETYDLFISYSSKDLRYAKKVAAYLKDNGFSVYIDDEDSLLDKNNVGENTTYRLARILDNCYCLLYLFTDNSSLSSWCPWEIGYMSGTNNFRCATLPIVDDPLQKYIEHREFLLNYPIVEHVLTPEGISAFYIYSKKESRWIQFKDFIYG